MVNKIIVVSYVTVIICIYSLNANSWPITSDMLIENQSSVYKALKTDEQREKEHPPVHGFSGKKTGVLGESSTGNAVAGYNDSPSQPAARFRNFGTGDQLIIDYGHAVPALRVANNGDVFVRGKLIGQQGEKGDQGNPGKNGKDGKDGAPGPAVRTVAVCAATPMCNCNGRKVSGSLGICTVTSDTGSCYSDTETGCCAVCAP